jgi:hypothetical protein
LSEIQCRRTDDSSTHGATKGKSILDP